MTEIYFTGFAIAAAVFFLFSEPAYAYLDPGTGSMILQALIAGAVAILAFGKRFYYFFSGLFSKKKNDDDDDQLTTDGDGA